MTQDAYSEDTAILEPLGSTAIERIATPIALVTLPSRVFFPFAYWRTSESSLPVNQLLLCDGFQQTVSIQKDAYTYPCSNTSNALPCFHSSIRVLVCALVCPPYPSERVCTAGVDVRAISRECESGRPRSRVGCVDESLSCHVLQVCERASRGGQREVSVQLSRVTTRRRGTLRESLRDGDMSHARTTLSCATTYVCTQQFAYVVKLLTGCDSNVFR